MKRRSASASVNSCAEARTCVTTVVILIHYKTFIMADSNAIVFPDEVEAVKDAIKAEQKVEDGDTNTVEQPGELPNNISLRNMITAPDNCPAGQQMGADGVCRVVF